MHLPLAYRLFQVDEPLLAYALIPELAVEALDIGVLHRLAGIHKAQVDANAHRPLIHRLSREFRAVVHDDVQRRPPRGGEPLKHRMCARQGSIHLDGQALACIVVDDAVQRAEDHPSTKVARMKSIEYRALAPVRCRQRHAVEPGALA